ncbi:MAG: polyphenol oxidase family protein [Actinomycetota bacterium]
MGDEAQAVDENRRRVASTARLDAPHKWVWLRQVHGATVHRAAGVPTVVPEADAAVTSVRGLPLAIVTADCAPVVLANDAALGLVHAGHRGLLSGVIEHAVAVVREAGEGTLRAFLGPCVHPARYEFGADDLVPIAARFGTDVVGATIDGTPALDIPAAVRIALARAGVDVLDDCGVCTAASAVHFSHRRDGPTGRQVTVAVLS